MKKEMMQVKVFVDADGICIAQGDDYLETTQLICISPSQAEIVASWIIEAAKELNDNA